MKLLLVNKNDVFGGAARIVSCLHQEIRARGNTSYLAVASKNSEDTYTRTFPDLPPVNGAWARLLWRLRELCKQRIGKLGTGVAMRTLRALADPCGEIKRRKGHEDFDYPGSRKLLETIPEKPNIVHLHNLHENYFDLNYLPELSKKSPVLITLHDEWLFTGHCAYTLGCNRWKTGCGKCPDLTIYPPIPRDATNYNWQKKREIFQQSRLYIATPSQWLLDKVEESILSPAIIEARVIPNGVDQNIFTPRSKAEVRDELNLPADSKIVLFILARNFKYNRFKDFDTTKGAISIIMRGKADKNILAIGVGSENAVEYFNPEEVKITGFINNEKQLAKYYQAADVFIHAAHSDNFPTTILESLSCGTPVVATAVDGIPEQITNGETGYLVPARDPQAIASCVMKILLDDELLSRMSLRAAVIAHERYDLMSMVSRYLSWYQEIIEN